jgi:hypothetical protein
MLGCAEATKDEAVHICLQRTAEIMAVAKKSQGFQLPPWAVKI